jgi:hypothetical protein
LTRQQRELAWVVVPAARFAADATPDDAAIKAYYDSTRANTSRPKP